MPADVLIVTVTKIESQSVLDVFSQATGQVAKRVPLDGKMYRDLGVVNEANVFMVRSEMGAGGLGAAQQTVHKGINSLSPAAVVMVGIAFGANENKQTIGDILVSKQIMLYDLQRVSTGRGGSEKIIPRGDRAHASPFLLDRLRSADEDRRDEKATVHFGLILSGEKLVDNLNFRQRILRLEPEAIGGEMEGAGLYAACQDRKVDWILVKGICDWADGHKEENRNERQRVAAYNAANFVLQMLQQAPLVRDGEPARKSPAVPTVALSPTSVIVRSDSPAVSESKTSGMKTVVCVRCGKRIGEGGWCLGQVAHDFKQLGSPVNGIWCPRCGRRPGADGWCLGSVEHAFQQLGSDTIYCPLCGKRPSDGGWCLGQVPHAFQAI
jgi:nucleoside phosphorylase/DNA-directed RNA polymerase subunit RPC12/RpoP